MLYIGVQHVDFIISLIGFITGLALLITPHINTTPSYRAFPILIGMGGLGAFTYFGNHSYAQNPVCRYPRNCT